MATDFIKRKSNEHLQTPPSQSGGSAPPRTKPATKIGVGDIFILIVGLLGGAWRLLIGGLALVGVGLFLLNSFSSFGVTHDSVSQLNAMSCKQFEGLSHDDQLTVGDRIYTAQSGSTDATDIQMGGANQVMNIDYDCQTNPAGTISQ